MSPQNASKIQPSSLNLSWSNLKKVAERRKPTDGTETSLWSNVSELGANILVRCGSDALILINRTVLDWLHLNTSHTGRSQKAGKEEPRGTCILFDKIFVKHSQTGYRRFVGTDNPLRFCSWLGRHFTWILRICLKTRWSKFNTNRPRDFHLSSTEGILHRHSTGTPSSTHL